MKKETLKAFDEIRRAMNGDLMMISRCRKEKQTFERPAILADLRGKLMQYLFARHKETRRVITYSQFNALKGNGLLEREGYVLMSTKKLKS